MSGGYRRNRNGGGSNRSFWAHDDRDIISERSSSFSYMNGGSSSSRYNHRQIRGGRRGKNTGRRFHDADGGDVDMDNIVITSGASGSIARFNPYRGGRRKGGQHPNYRHQLAESTTGWYKVTLASSSKYSREELFSTLKKRIQLSDLRPYGVKTQDSDLAFYVDDRRIACILHDSNLKINTKEGWKLQIKVTASIPLVEVTTSLEDKIKQVMATRYSPVDNILDLSKFHADEVFVKENIFVPLNCHNVLAKAFQIMESEVPHLRLLNLSDNRIHNTESFILMKNGLTSLKSLDLSKNSIKDVKYLFQLRGMPLEELSLDENPLCQQFNDTASYIRELRRIFPKLTKLDGVVLPVIVSFGLEEEEEEQEEDENSRRMEEIFSSSLRQYVCNPAGVTIVQQFIQQYYTMYDSIQGPGRSQLADAYHDSAQFSLSAYVNQTKQNLSAYIGRSRNLIKVQSQEQRFNFLKRGKTEIINFLGSLPKSQHDPDSFCVDLLHFAPEMVHICVCGMFREEQVNSRGDSGDWKWIRSFNRSFVLRANADGGGFKIISDQLLVTHPTGKQLKMALSKNPVVQQQAVQSASDPGSTSMSVVPSPAAQVAPSEMERRIEMVKALAAQTRMNLAWSEKCLNETDWQFNEALTAFAEFHKRGNIPAEAFL